MEITKKPAWLKARYHEAETRKVRGLLENLQLNTVCNEAGCPNMGGCYRRSVAAFMILGRNCTRNCAFCAVNHGAPEDVNPDEPANIAKAAAALGLRHVVLTSVTRDDLPDGGAAWFAACVNALRETSAATVEILIPDFQGDEAALDAALAAKPDVLNHNLETVPRLYPTVRPEADYKRSLRLLAYCKAKAPDVLTKTGIMVGFGETEAEVLALMDDARQAGCALLTVGQYLRPTPRNLPVAEYVTPGQFEKYQNAATEKGFRHAVCAPFARSSYHAEEALQNV
jgi:lipoic acid synthetase